MNPRLALSALAICLALCGCSPAPPAATGADEPPRPVQTTRVGRRPMERSVRVTGSLAAQDSATLSIKVPGRLRSLNVDLGSEVAQGEILAQVEPRDYELRLQQAAAALSQARAAVGLPLEGDDDRVALEKASLVKEAQAVLDEARKNRDRVLNLSREGISSKAEVDTVDASFNVAQNRYESALQEIRTRQAALAQRRAEYEIARQQLNDTSMRAPFDGAVQTRIADLGEFLPGGAPVIELVKKGLLRLRLEVPERESTAVHTGEVVRLTVEGDAHVYSGHLTRLSPAVSEPKRVLLAEADIPAQGGLRPGLFARAEIVTLEDDPGLAVPADALIIFAGLEKLITLEEGRAVEVVVTTGRRGPDWVEILSGVAEGAIVVARPGSLRAGQRVVLQDTAPPVAQSRPPSGRPSP